MSLLTQANIEDGWDDLVEVFRLISPKTVPNRLKISLPLLLRKLLSQARNDLDTTKIICPVKHLTANFSLEDLNTF